MNRKVLSFSCFPILLALTACSVFLPAFQDNPIPSMETSSITSIPLITVTSTSTQVPSATSTSTSLPPSTTPIQIAASTITPTAISKDLQLSIFENLWTIVNDTYVYPDFNGLDWNAIRVEIEEKISQGLTNEEFYQAISETMYKLGDYHSVFLNPQEQADAEAEYRGNLDYVGIGVLVSAVPERKHAVILSVFPNSPAEAAGLSPRDSILSVDGTSILDENGFLQDIVRGPEGTTIDISAQTPGQFPRNIRVTRHRITGEIPVMHTVLTTPEGKRIGYILIVTFDDSTVDEQVASALKEMTREAPLDGLILDNRMNGGGSSTVFEPTLSFFVGGKLGFFIKRNDERPLVIKVDDINGSSQVPLVVLVGSGTVSFGEIFAGILKDQGRAYLIGTTTSGNVEILGGYDFEDGSHLWLANETFRPYNHPEQDWEKTGIIPDQTVKGEFDEFTIENDPAVSAAIQYLSNR